LLKPSSSGAEMANGNVTCCVERADDYADYLSFFQNSRLRLVARRGLREALNPETLRCVP
jgi:hypothetical protein